MKKYLLKNNNVNFRISNLSDLDFIYNIRNSPEIRLASFNTDEIDYDNHIVWFENKLKCKNDMYIVNIDSQDIGYFRLDLIKDNLYKISFAIDKLFTGHGYGVLLLKYAKNEFKEKTLIGEVKKNNIPSIKSFEKAGYILYKEIKDKKIYISR